MRRRAWANKAEEAAQHVIMEYGELFLFLLVAITYVNTLEERRVFDVLRVQLTGRNLSYRSLFWLTGILAFFLSGVLDNLTTALVMGAVVLAIGSEFAALRRGLLHQHCRGGQCRRRLLALRRHHHPDGLAEGQADVLRILRPVRAFAGQLAGACSHHAVRHSHRQRRRPARETVRAKPGANGVIVLFALTIATAVAFRNFLHLPPALGMMLGLGYLQVWSYFLQRKGARLAERRHGAELLQANRAR